MITEATAFKLEYGTLTFTWQCHMGDSLSTCFNLNFCSLCVFAHRLCWESISAKLAPMAPLAEIKWKSCQSARNILCASFSCCQWGNEVGLSAYLMPLLKWVKISSYIRGENTKIIRIPPLYLTHLSFLIIPSHSCQLNLTGIWILILPSNFVDRDATMLAQLCQVNGILGVSFCKSVRRFTSKRHQILLNGETLSSTIITWQCYRCSFKLWLLNG